jgi:hypothetical protein
MGFKEINIDGGYKLYGNFYHARIDNKNLNPFLASHRAAMAGSSDPPTQFHLERWTELDAFGILAANPAGDKFIPLIANLVLPDGVGTPPYPFAIFIHGRASSYSGSGSGFKEVASYRGYRYLQQYLAEKGVASMSVNANVPTFLDSVSYQPTERLQVSMLILSLLTQLSGKPVTTGQHVLFKKADGTLVPLQEAVELEGSFASDSAEQLLKTLRSSLTGKISMATLGFMGHSRGGSALLALQPLFSPRDGNPPSNPSTPGNSTTTLITSPPSGVYNSNTVQGGVHRKHAHLYHHTMNIMASLGNPSMDAVKTLVALQPKESETLIVTEKTFYLVVASSHDEDVQEESINEYDKPSCPKAMIFSHGASHARFNTVWRQLPDIKTKINKQIGCQPKIYMLSNDAHEALAKATVGNALLAGLLGENHRYGFFTGEIRAPGLKQDIERAWKFPFPFTSPPPIKVLDGPAIKAFKTSDNSEVTPTIISALNSRKVDNHDNYINDIKVFAFTRKANVGLAIRIPIKPADKLVSRTHFSFRYTKEYDARKASARSKVNLRHYTLQLKAGSSKLGLPVNGADVPSPHHVAYPTADFDSTCKDDTGILMQTAEIPLSQFLGTQPITDLNLVTQIEITINPLTGAKEIDETFFFVDFLLSSRKLPPPPPGFSIP